MLVGPPAYRGGFHCGHGSSSGPQPEHLCAHHKTTFTIARTGQRSSRYAGSHTFVNAYPGVHHNTSIYGYSRAFNHCHYHRTGHQYSYYYAGANTNFGYYPYACAYISSDSNSHPNPNGSADSHLHAGVRWYLYLDCGSATGSVLLRQNNYLQDWQPLR